MNDKFLLIFDSDGLSKLQTLEIANLGSTHCIKIVPKIEILELLSARLEKFKYIVIISSCSKFLNYFSNKSGVLPICIDDEKDLLNDSYDILFLPSYNFISRLPSILKLKNLIALLDLRIEDVHNSTNFLKKTFYDKYLTQKGVYIFGVGAIGQQIYKSCYSKKIDVLGFIDNDSNLWGKKLFGITILNPASIKDSDHIFIIANGKFSREIALQLKENGCNNVYNISELFSIIEDDNQPEKDYAANLTTNRIGYFSLAFSLDDEKSLAVLDAVLEHRMTLSIDSLANVFERDRIQWFDADAISLEGCNVFVDGGSFDGDTIQSFINLRGIENIKEMHVFEIDPALLKRAKIRLLNIANVIFHDSGLGDRNESILFEATGNTGGRISNVGSLPVKLATIDGTVFSKINLIKLDVEGYERRALLGSAKQIRISEPILALAAYHRAEDLLVLPRFIRLISRNYVFKLRHYTQVAFETVLYAIPKKIDRKSL